MFRWICRLLLAPLGEKKRFLRHPDVKSWYEHLSNDDFKLLKEYIYYKYHFKEIQDAEKGTEENLRFLEDFILFGNPDRERWENTRSSFKRLKIKKGSVIADVGAGPGYFSMKLADIAGRKGKVYAIETNPLHIEYLKSHIEKYKIPNIVSVTGSTEGIGLDESIKTDVVLMCSLYHVIYAVLTEEERDGFVGGIQNALKEGGKLIIIDNGLVEDCELPYHGPFIAKELIAAQLQYYGFKLIDDFQFTPQRYALVFEKLEKPEIQNDYSQTEFSENFNIQIKNKMSIVRFRLAGAAPTAGFTDGGQNAAKLFVTALETKQNTDIENAISAYEKLIPTERIGDEYTAFKWFLNLLRSDEDVKAKMLEKDIVREYNEYFAKDDYALLKKYLYYKYELGGKSEGSGASPSRDFADIGVISEYITFNNPARDEWERTVEMYDFFGIKEGMSVAD